MEREQEPWRLIEMDELSDNLRVFSTAYLRTDLAGDVASAISRHPYVDTVRIVDSGPTLGFEVTTSEPSLWNMYIDPHCRQMIEFGIDAQSW